MNLEFWVVDANIFFEVLREIEQNPNDPPKCSKNGFQRPAMTFLSKFAGKRPSCKFVYSRTNLGEYKTSFGRWKNYAEHPELRFLLISIPANFRRGAYKKVKTDTEKANELRNLLRNHGLPKSKDAEYVVVAKFSGILPIPNVVTCDSEFERAREYIERFAQVAVCQPVDALKELEQASDAADGR